MIKLFHPSCNLQAKIQISGSKSESNRWLILQALYPEIQKIHNLSNSEDTQTLQKALKLFQNNPRNQHEPLDINIGHAGTAMRFLTAYFAIQPQSHVQLSGSHRMHQRPINPLVQALDQLGCQIEYAHHQDYPPLFIQGRDIEKNQTEIQADMSSQFISALMLIAPKLPNGLEITLKEKLTSQTYVEMTIKQLQHIGIPVDWNNNIIKVHHVQKVDKQDVRVESDWSSASYWYAMMALSNQAQLELNHFQQNSLQGDYILKDIYEKYFGVKTIFQDGILILSKIEDFILPVFIELNLNAFPDLAQTIAVTCAGLNIQLNLKGLETLKIKETNRLQAMQNELNKLNIKSTITDDSLQLLEFSQYEENTMIETYQDHRMAMSFAVLALKKPLIIKDENVVDKSYPKFWQDLKSAGFEIELY